MKWILSLMILGMSATIQADVFPERFYVEPDQVCIEKDRIYIHLLGSMLPVSSIHVDLQGLHVLANEVIDQHTFSNTCPLGHFSPNGSGQCNQNGCPFQKKK